MGGNRRQFPACDGLRAVAAGSVLVFHAVSLTGVIYQSQYGKYLRQLDVGVDIFFVLSGFLLYRPFVRAHLDGDNSPAVGRYLKHRFLRIFPAYWVVLAAVVWIFGQARVGTVGAGFVYFGLGQIYSKWHVLGGLTPAWSLCTEAAFYVFLPIYAFVLGRVVRSRSVDPLRAELIGLGALYIGCTLFRLVTSASGYHLAATWLPAYIDVFALGMFLAVLSVLAERDPKAQWLQAIPKSATAWWAAAFAVFLIMANLGYPLGLEGTSTSTYMAYRALGALMGFLIVCPAVLHYNAGGGGREVLTWPAMRWLGLISYGIFLWHLPLMTEAVKWTGGKTFDADFQQVMMVTVPLTIAAAWLTYVFVERPLNSGLRRRSRGLRRSADRQVVNA